MDTTLLLWLLAIILVATGIAGLLLPAMPGAPLLLAGLVLAAWAENFTYVGIGTLALLTFLAILTYIADFFAGAMGARKFGASTRAMLGATLGAGVGIFFGIAGILLGPFIGALLGELSTGRGLHAAGKAGIGASIGLLLGIAAKFALAISMLGVFVLQRFL